MPRNPVAVPKKRPGPKAPKLAEEFTKGTVITDVLKKQWRLGEVIGQGGFGLVYLANSADSSTSSEAQFVIKIEPGANGPLFCEMNFYIRAAKKEFIQEFIKSHKLKYLAVPPYIGSGIHTYNTTSYRFLVMPRYGTDLQKLLQSAGGTFPTTTVFAIGIRMVDALQYLHEREYVHADVKASNILLGYDGRFEDRNQVYLADYGLAYRYTVNDEHKAYKEDPRNCHNGTLQFTSRDAHRGVFPSRRGDLEILGFCLLQWLCGKLPWENDLLNPVFVAQKKEECMKSVRSFVNSCLSGMPASSSDCIFKFLQEVNKLDYTTEPNYKTFKDILHVGLNKAGQKDEWQINFPTDSKAKKRKSQDSIPGVNSPKKQMVGVKKGKASPAPQKIDVSPVKKRGRPPKKSPSGTTSPLKMRALPPKKSENINGKASNIVSPSGKRKVNADTPRSLLKASSSTGKRFDALKHQKTHQIPAPSKHSLKKSPGTPKKKKTVSYVRRVRKANTSQSDASIQTTPGLKSNV